MTQDLYNAGELVSAAFIAAHRGAELEAGIQPVILP